MQQHEFTAQNASDEVLRQAEKLDNLVPTLTEWSRLESKAIAETLRTGKPLEGFTEEAHVSVAFDRARGVYFTQKCENHR